MEPGKISVLVRGDISKRIFETWQAQMLKKFKFSVSSDYVCGSKYIVLSANCSESNLLAWTNNEKLANKVNLVKPEWIVVCLKSGKLVSTELYQHKLHDLVGAVKTEIQKDTNNVENCLVENRHSTDLITHSQNINSTICNTDRPVYNLKNNFVCSKSGTANLGNSNQHITDKLEKLQAIYEQSGDEWRAQGYKKSIAMLKQQPAITSKEQLIGLKLIGKSLRDKIIEILETGTVKKLGYMQNNPRIQAITELSNIWGVGDKTAENLYKQGYHSVAELRRRGKHLLNAQQLVGLCYYEEFLVKIPRSEVQEIHHTVEEELKKLVPNAECVVCGSYRRGKTQCGDVDVLMFPTASSGIESLPSNTLARLIFALEQRGFLTDHLALPSKYYQHIDTINSSSSSASISRTTTTTSHSTVPLLLSTKSISRSDHNTTTSSTAYNNISRNSTMDSSSSSSYHSNNNNCLNDRSSSLQFHTVSAYSTQQQQQQEQSLHHTVVVANEVNNDSGSEEDTEYIDWLRSSDGGDLLSTIQQQQQRPPQLYHNHQQQHQHRHSQYPDAHNNITAVVVVTQSSPHSTQTQLSTQLSNTWSPSSQKYHNNYHSHYTDALASPFSSSSPPPLSSSSSSSMLCISPPSPNYDNNAQSDEDNDRIIAAGGSSADGGRGGGSSTVRSSYMGVCRVLTSSAVTVGYNDGMNVNHIGNSNDRLCDTNRLHRRIDMKIYPRSLSAFALLYFTGSDHFNRSMRLYASKKGYSLNDKGLSVCVRDAQRNKLSTGYSIPCYSEREIFAALKLDYKEPWERNCFDTNNIGVIDPLTGGLVSDIVAAASSIEKEDDAVSVTSQEAAVTSMEDALSVGSKRKLDKI